MMSSEGASQARSAEARIERGESVMILMSSEGASQARSAEARIEHVSL
jgi:hypothetical protein